MNGVRLVILRVLGSPREHPDNVRPADLELSGSPSLPISGGAVLC
jgi:hypothetical protein